MFKVCRFGFFSDLLAEATNTHTFSDSTGYEYSAGSVWNFYDNQHITAC